MLDGDEFTYCWQQHFFSRQTQYSPLYDDVRSKSNKESIFPTDRPIPAIELDHSQCPLQLRVPHLALPKQIVPRVITKTSTFKCYLCLSCLSAQTTRPGSWIPLSESSVEDHLFSHQHQISLSKNSGHFVCATLLLRKRTKQQKIPTTLTTHTLLAHPVLNTLFIFSFSLQSELFTDVVERTRLEIKFRRKIDLLGLRPRDLLLSRFSETLSPQPAQ